jgi:hypothetical protein
MAYGSGTLVTGAVTIATGLNTVSSFAASLTGTGAKTTGAAEVATLQVASIATGSVVVQGFFNSFVTGTPTISASGTATFNWIAIGT